MKNFIVVILLLIASLTIKAQNFPNRNSIMVESNLILTLDVSYDRIIPIKEKIALMIGGDYLMGIGFGYGAHFIVPETNLLLFGPKHFLETGIQYAFDVDQDKDYNDSSPGIRFAYRFQAEKGLTFRATLNVFFDIDPVIPTVGIGYTF